MANGLSVFEYDNLYQEISKVQGVSEEDVKRTLSLLDLLKSKRINDRKEIDVTDVVMVDAYDDEGNKLPIWGITAWADDLLDYILKNV